MDADGESYQSSIVTSCESFLRCTKSPLNRRKPRNNNIFFYVLLPWRSSFNRVCKFFYRSASVWQVERSPGRWKTLNLEWSTWLEDAWSNDAGEVTLEDKEVRE